MTEHEVNIIKQKAHGMTKEEQMLFVIEFDTEAVLTALNAKYKGMEDQLSEVKKAVGA